MEIIKRLSGFKTFIYSKQGKKFLSVTYPRIKDRLRFAWLWEMLYAKYDDTNTGEVYETKLENDFGEQLDGNDEETYPDYADLEREIIDSDRNLVCRKQPPSTCGQETINNIIREQLVKLGVPASKVPLVVTAIDAMYRQYSPQDNGTNTFRVYPKIVSNGVTLNINSEIEDRIAHLFTINFFKEIVARTTDKEQFYKWVDKAHKSNDLLVTMSKHNSRAVNAYGRTIVTLNKNKSTERTGGHITGLNTIYGVFMLEGERSVRTLESSFSKTSDSYRLYKDSVLDVAFNVCTVFRVNEKFKALSNVSNQKDAVAILTELLAQKLDDNLTNTTIVKGQNGDAVVKLQEYLERQGYFTYKGTKGYFGEITRVALEKWQIDKLGKSYGGNVWGSLSQKVYKQNL